MLSDQVCVEVRNLSKIYEIYARPVHRLMQTLFCGTRHFYREFRALDNVSFRVKTGQCFGIIGMNGAGKSTTMKLILGLCRKDSGNIFRRSGGPWQNSGASGAWKRFLA